MNTGIELLLNGDVRELRRLAGFIENFCRERGLGEDVAFDLNLAIEELFVNAVKHGGCRGMENAARVRLQLADGDVAVEVADRGSPFDPTAAPARPASGGLGIHLVRHIMRDLRYTREDEWNCVMMRRPL